MSTDLPPRKATVEFHLSLDDTVELHVKAAPEQEIKSKTSPILQEAGLDRVTAEKVSTFLEDIRDPVTLGSLLTREAEAVDAPDPETALMVSQLKLMALLISQRYQEALKANEEAIDLASDQKSSSVRPGETPEEATMRVSHTTSQIKLSADLMTLPDLYATRALLLKHLERLEEALVNCEQATRLAPDHLMAHLIKAQALLALQRYEEAIGACRRVIQLSAGQGWAYDLAGCALFQVKRYDEALVAFEEALRFAPEEAELHVKKGKTLTGLERYQKAIEAFEQALRLDPAHTQALFHRGVALNRLHRYKDALMDFEAYLHVHPTGASAANEKSFALLRLKRAEEALAVCTKILLLHPTNAEAYVSQARVLSHLKRYEKALDAYQQALQLGYGEGEELPLGEAARLQKEVMRRFDPNWQPRPPRNPKKVLAHKGRGLVLFHLKRYQEALLAFEQAQSFNKDMKDETMIYYKGRAYYRLKQYGKAVAAYAEASNFSGRERGFLVYRSKGDALVRLKYYAEAVSAYGSALNQYHLYSDLLPSLDNMLCAISMNTTLVLWLPIDVLCILMRSIVYVFQKRQKIDWPDE